MQSAVGFTSVKPRRYRASEGDKRHTVRAGTHLAKEALDAVFLQPRCGVRKALGADGAGDALVRSAGAIGVEVLVHLDGGVVKRILDGRLCEGR